MIVKYSMLVLVFLTAGCARLSVQTKTIPKGTLINIVQAEFGLPDLISDRSGDLARYYTPYNRPASEWPPYTPHTFYYLQHNLKIVFKHGRALNASSLTPEELKTLEHFLQSSEKTD